MDIKFFDIVLLVKKIFNHRRLHMNNYRFSSYVGILLCCFVLVLSNIAYTQVEGGIGPSLPNASAASFYYISKPGELTMQVNIWGAVQKPGRYEIPTSTDLVQLVSYAGGPNQDAKIDKVKIMRGIKKEGGTSKEEYFLDLEELSTIDESKLVLYPGDTIFIDRSSWSTVKDWLPIVTTAVIVTSTIINVIILDRRLR